MASRIFIEGHAAYIAGLERPSGGDSIAANAPNASLNRAFASQNSHWPDFGSRLRRRILSAFSGEGFPVPVVLARISQSPGRFRDRCDVLSFSKKSAGLNTIQAGEDSVRRAASPPVSLRLVDIPEHRRGRAVEHAGKRLPPHAGPNVLAQRDVDDLFIGMDLDLGGELLLLVGRGRARELVAQLFHLGVFEPAEPAAVLAPAADRHVCNRV